MTLSESQIAEYWEKGFLPVGQLFDEDEVELMRNQLPVVYAEDTPARVLEEGTDFVRMVHGCHKTNEVFSRLARNSRIVEPAKQLLDDDVYVHQFKINAKAAFAGDVWAWHQDYVFWKNEDGMPSPQAVNAAIFLDDVTEFNGPLIFIPGTHDMGTPDSEAQDIDHGEDPDWKTHLTVKLKYELSQETLAEMVEERGLIAPKGKAGTVMFFSPSIFHGSAPNMSPWDRTMALVSFNSVKNQLQDVESPRPWFLAERDFTPVGAEEGRL